MDIEILLYKYFYMSYPMWMNEKERRKNIAKTRTKAQTSYFITLKITILLQIHRHKLTTKGKKMVECQLKIKIFIVFIIHQLVIYSSNLQWQLLVHQVLHLIKQPSSTKNFRFKDNPRCKFHYFKQLLVHQVLLLMKLSSSTNNFCFKNNPKCKFHSFLSYHTQYSPYLSLSLSMYNKHLDNLLSLLFGLLRSKLDTQNHIYKEFVNVAVLKR